MRETHTQIAARLLQMARAEAPSWGHKLTERLVVAGVGRLWKCSDCGQMASPYLMLRGLCLKSKGPSLCYNERVRWSVALRQEARKNQIAFRAQVNVAKRKAMNLYKDSVAKMSPANIAAHKRLRKVLEWRYWLPCIWIIWTSHRLGEASHPGPLKILSWNLGSLRLRQVELLEIWARRQISIALIQEHKVPVEVRTISRNLLKEGWQIFWGCSRQCGYGEAILVHRDLSVGVLPDGDPIFSIAVKTSRGMLIRIGNIYSATSNHALEDQSNFFTVCVNGSPSLVIGLSVAISITTLLMILPLRLPSAFLRKVPGVGPFTMIGVIRWMASLFPLGFCLTPLSLVSMIVLALNTALFFSPW